VYALEITIVDPNSATKKKLSITERVEINFPKDKVSLSDIQLVESFTKSTKPGVLTKSGYDLVPYSVFSFDDAMTRLSFYCEAYNTAKIAGSGKRIAFFYYIENYSTKEKAEGYASFSKQNAQEVNVLLSQFELKKLATGSYNLVVEVRDEKNELLATKKIPFHRTTKETISQLADLSTIVADSTIFSNVTSIDTLVDYIRCVWPISTLSQRDYATTQIKLKDKRQMQKYLHAFWVSKNAGDPAGEWKKYKTQVAVVNSIFAAGKIKGYASDRGRVYLQYGTPDSRQTVNSEPNTYPYEIWQYYKLVDPVTGAMQTNKRFVFCDNELAGNNYRLIHSEARGETYDIRWQYKIMKRTTANSNLDDTTPAGTYGNNLDDNFVLPK
jgi:GWxTD domain-containing protein